MVRPSLTYVLVADGKSDRVLLPILDWTIRANWPEALLGNRTVVAREGRDLQTECRTARERHSPRLLIVHRDAERESLAQRASEIAASDPGAVPVVPVRMTEAWLLFDVDAIRAAADNPSGRVRLDLPLPRRLEDLPDPKQVLHAALTAASEETGPRRRKRFQRDLPARIDRLSHLIRDYSPLRELSAFREFESQLESAIRELRARDEAAESQ